MIAEPPAIDLVRIEEAITQWKADPNLYAAPSVTKTAHLSFPLPYIRILRGLGKTRDPFEPATGATGPANLLRIQARPTLRVSDGQQLVAELQPDDSEVSNLNGRVVSHYLTTRGVVPDRTHEATDGTVIIEYLRHRFASVDVYPNGDVVVILASGDADDIYEFDLRDLPKVANLLTDAGFAG